jgi:acyl carrier protein
MADGIRERVIRFLADQLGIEANRFRAETRLFHDLGCDGDDAAELVEHFTRTFDVTLTNFSLARHFGSEAAYNPLVYLYMRLRRPERLRKVPLTVADLVAAAEVKSLQSPERAAV